MRSALCVSVLLGFLAAPLRADIVDAADIPIGPNSVQYRFTLAGFDLLQYQVLDIRFDASLFVKLSNPVAPANFTAMDFSPSGPTPGDFLVEALISNPAVTPGLLALMRHSSQGTPRLTRCHFSSISSILKEFRRV